GRQKSGGWGFLRTSYFSLHPFVDNGTTVGDDGLPEDVVVEVEAEAVLGEVVEEEGGDGAGVHLAGVVGHLRREVRRAEHLDTGVEHALVGPRDGAVAAVGGGEVHDHG